MVRENAIKKASFFSKFKQKEKKKKKDTELKQEKEKVIKNFSLKSYF